LCKAKGGVGDTVAVKLERSVQGLACPLGSEVIVKEGGKTITLCQREENQRRQETQKSGQKRGELTGCTGKGRIKSAPGSLSLREVPWG